MLHIVSFVIIIPLPFSSFKLHHFPILALKLYHSLILRFHHSISLKLQHATLMFLGCITLSLSSCNKTLYYSRPAPLLSYTTLSHLFLTFHMHQYFSLLHFMPRGTTIFIYMSTPPFLFKALPLFWKSPSFLQNFTHCLYSL